MRRIGSIDLDTGTLLEGIPVWVGRKTSFTQLYGLRWLVISQNRLLELANDKELTAQEPMRVFLYLAARLDFENFIHLPQAEVCAALGMKKQNVSKAIKLLVKRGVLLRGPKVGHSYCFRFNPNYGYKGNPKGKVQRSTHGHLELVGGQDVTPTD